MATIYQPINLYPDNIPIDMEQIQTFSCEVNGDKITAYLLRIYNSSDTIVYEDDTTLSASEYVYNGEQLEITIPSTNGCVNGNEYTWILTYYNGAESKVSFEIPFSATSTPNFSISVPATIDDFYYNFEGSYLQDEDIGLEYWYYKLYDANGDVIIVTDNSYDIDISHTFLGFISGESYGVKGFGRMNNKVEVETEMYTFDVFYTYSLQHMNIDDSLGSSYTILEVYDAVIQDFIATGTYSYQDNVFTSGNYGISLGSGSDIALEIDIPAEFSLVHFTILESTTDGALAKIYHSTNGDYVEIGYSQVETAFYINIDGVITYTSTYNIDNTKFYKLYVDATELKITEY